MSDSRVSEGRVVSPRFATLLVVCAASLALALHAQDRRDLLQLVNRTVHGTVVAVGDGDSIRVQLEGSGGIVPVRLEGVDTPEMGEPFSTQARNATRVLMFDKGVEVRGVDVDQYDRLVARVIVDGQDSSTHLLRAGLACHFTRFENDPVLARAQLDARNSGRGFWAPDAPKPRSVTFAKVDAPAPAGAAPGAAAAAPAMPAVRPQAPNPSVIFHGNRRSRVYHAPSCRNYNCPNCTVIFNSAEDAQKAGYRPAGDCLR